MPVAAMMGGNSTKQNACDVGASLADVFGRGSPQQQAGKWSLFKAVCLLLLQVIVVSLMVGSLFFQLGHHVSDARTFYGAAFMAVLFMAMGSMPQIGVVMAQKAVWLKHRDSLLYPGYAHGVVSRVCLLIMQHVTMMPAIIATRVTACMSCSSLLSKQRSLCVQSQTHTA